MIHHDGCFVERNPSKPYPCKILSVVHIAPLCRLDAVPNLIVDSLSRDNQIRLNSTITTSPILSLQHTHRKSPAGAVHLTSPPSIITLGDFTIRPSHRQSCCQWHNSLSVTMSRIENRLGEHLGKRLLCVLHLGLNNRKDFLVTFDFEFCLAIQRDINPTQTPGELRQGSGVHKSDIELIQPSIPSRVQVPIQNRNINLLTRVIDYLIPTHQSSLKWGGIIKLIMKNRDVFIPNMCIQFRVRECHFNLLLIL